MRKIISISVLSLLFVLSVVGCSTTATLYPIEGPLSQNSPPPVIKATVDGITGNTGNVFLTMPDGEVCKGRWASLAPQSYIFSTGSASARTVGKMDSVWATVYGSSFSVGNVPGVNKGEAMLIGDRGTVIQVEFYTASGTANGTGVAKDNKGNVYKLIF